MARATITDHGHAYTVNFLDGGRRGDLFQAVLLAQLVDELTDGPVRAPVRVTCDHRAARPVAGRAGIAGLAGVPSRIFPRLDIQPYQVTVHFEVDGFVPVDRVVPFSVQGAFPAAFDLIDLGRVDLRRRPVTITVRAVRLDPAGGTVAVGGATVTVAGIWRSVAVLASSAGSAAANLIALSPPLYAERPVGTTLEPVALNLVVEPERLLLADVGPGERTLPVSRSGGLVIGSVVGLDRTDADRAEHVEVADVRGPSDPASPATVVLAFPVRHRHLVNAPVARVTVAVLGGPPATLDATGAPGDATVFVNTVGPFGAGPAVRVSGGAGPDEYAVASAYRATTDALGYARLPSLARVAALTVDATAGPLTAAPKGFTPDYAGAGGRLDLTLE